MAEPRTQPRHISAGVILVDPQGRVLMQLRDDNPKIMFPGHWGLTGGAGHAGETPEHTARREIEEETGLQLASFEPFRAYYFAETKGGKKPQPGRADYEVYVFHAPCATPVEELVCGEGRELRFIAPDEFASLDVAYNHAEVLTDFFASPAYALYVSGAAFEGGDAGETISPIERFVADLDAGSPWFETMMDAIAAWQQPDERVGERLYRYLVGGEAFDWLLLAERLLAEAGDRVPAGAAEALLFGGVPPDAEGKPMDDQRLRALIGDAKHRAHLNYVYGVTVEEALQYAMELEVSKERTSVAIKDPRDDETPVDPVYERIYGQPCVALLREFGDERSLPRSPVVSLTEMREFLYWLFKYRVAHSEPARVASDTRKALAQLSAIEDSARRSRRLREREEMTPV